MTMRFVYKGAASLEPLLEKGDGTRLAGSRLTAAEGCDTLYVKSGVMEGCGDDGAD